MGIHYKIYQIDMNLDTAFRELKEIGKPNPENYLLVYEGEMPGKADAGQADASGDLACLEKLFQIFNASIPSDYKSKSIWARASRRSSIPAGKWRLTIP